MERLRIRLSLDRTTRNVLYHKQVAPGRVAVLLTLRRSALYLHGEAGIPSDMCKADPLETIPLPRGAMREYSLFFAHATVFSFSIFCLRTKPSEVRDC